MLSLRFISIFNFCLATSACLLTTSVFAIDKADKASRLAVLTRAPLGLQITSLTIPSDPLPIREAVLNGKPTLNILIKGETKEPDSTLIVDNKIVRTYSSNPIKISVALNGPVTKISVIEITALGKKNNETLTLSFPGYEAWALASGIRSNQDTRGLGSHFTLGVAPSLIAYHESGVPDFNETVLTLKGGYSRRFSPNWDGSFGGFGTAIPLMTSSSGVSARFYGLNVRLGYSPKLARRSYAFTLSGGIYYTTTKVTGDAFGFRNMSGPRIYPSVTKFLNNRNSMSAYLKYSPVSNTLSGFSFSNREFGLGGVYTWPRPHGRALLATLDLARLHLTFPNAVFVESNSASMGGAYVF